MHVWYRDKQISVVMLNLMNYDSDPPKDDTEVSGDHILNQDLTAGEGDPKSHSTVSENKNF